MPGESNGFQKVLKGSKGRWSSSIQGVRTTKRQERQIVQARRVLGLQGTMRVKDLGRASLIVSGHLL